MKLTATLGLTITLAACSPARPVVLTPPAHLLHCADAPAVPIVPPRDGTLDRERERDQITVKLWLDEREAGADCRGKVDAMRVWSEGLGEKS